MRDATNNKSFGSVLTDIHEVQNCIDYIVDDVYIFFYRSDFRIETLTLYKDMIC